MASIKKIAGVVILIIVSLLILHNVTHDIKVDNVPKIEFVKDSTMLDISVDSDLLSPDNELTWNDTKEFKPMEISQIVVHCTGSRSDLSKQWLLNFFKNERGWSKPGYHFVVHTDGAISELVHLNDDSILDWDEVAYGARGYNSISIHVVYTGGIDEYLRPKDTRTDAQKETLLKLILELQCKYNIYKVVGHRDLPDVHKACPSFNVESTYDLIDFNNDLFDLNIK